MKFALFGIALLSSAHGATLSGTFSAATNTSAATAAVLPSGTVADNTDWGYFTPPTGAVSSINPSNTSSAGPRTFTVTGLGTTTDVRGSTTNTTGFYKYSNGQSPVSNTVGFQLGGVFNAATGPAGVTAGAGVQMTAGAFAVPSLIQLYVYNFNATGVFTAYVNNVATYTQTIADVSGAKAGYLFNLTFTPDTLADQIRFEYVMTAQSNNAANVGFQAIAISPIPETSSVALLGAAGILGLARRKRRA